MEQYKLINAELMDQVQKQRILIGEMLKTEVLLKRQLLEERETRLADAQYHENKLKCAIRTLLSSLDLNLDNSTDQTSPLCSLTLENAKEKNYNSGQVCLELRRSSGLLQRTVASSPNRQRRSHGMNSVTSCDESRVEEVENHEENISLTEKVTYVRKIPEPRHLVELQNNMGSPDSPEAVKVVSEEENEDLNQLPSTTPAAYMYSIIEESDSEENTFSQSVNEHETQRLRTTISSVEKSPLPLRDLTNNTDRIIPSPKAVSSIIILNSTQIDTDNTIQETSINQISCVPHQESIGYSFPTITKERGKSVRGSKINYKNPSIELVRHAAPSTSPTQVILPCTLLNQMPDLTPRRSQLNFTAFNGIVDRPGDSSTPRRDNESINTKWKPADTSVKPKRTKSTTGKSDQSNSDSTLLSRPSRSCRPKSLKEPSCIKKLRNESQTK